jgi:hypothetical protein
MLIALVGLIAGVTGVEYALTVTMAQSAYGVPWWGATLGGIVVALT